MRYFYLFLSVILMLSCTSELDFDQAENLEITPVFEGDIFYLDIYNTNLVDSHSNFRNEILDTVDFGIFKDGKARDSFEKAIITASFNNSFNRNFHTEYFFIDENNQAVEQGDFDILPATSTNITGEKIFTFDKITNPNFINFRKIVVKITVTPNTLPVEDEHLHIQTKGKIFTKILLN